MRKFLLFVFITLLTMCFMLDANARRFGGGKSFGASRSSYSNSYSRQANNTPYNYNRNASSSPLSKSNISRWLAPLAGFALGGLIASLFMGHGLGSGILSWLMVLCVAYLVWRLIAMFMQNKQQNYQQSRMSPIYNRNEQNQNNPFNFSHAAREHAQHTAPFAGLAKQVESNSGIHQLHAAHDDFDQEDFLRKAKSQFIRLQAAYDQKNIADLHEFTAPDVFAEIQLQLHERGENTNHTEVVSLNAELLGTEFEVADRVASVRFSGVIKEDLNKPAEAFQEIWHFKKLADQSTWKVIGIQQEG